MRNPIPQLERAEATVLRVIRDRGVVRGYDLLRETQPELSEDEILSAVRLLVKSDLISVDGSCNNLEQVAKAYLTLRPSAKGIADFALQAAL